LLIHDCLSLIEKHKLFGSSSRNRARSLFFWIQCPAAASEFSNSTIKQESRQSASPFFTRIYNRPSFPAIPAVPVPLVVTGGGSALGFFPAARQRKVQ
jgi:hypothetical protein